MVESESKLHLHPSKGKEKDRQFAQLIDYAVYPKIANMSFQKLNKENPSYLKMFQCNDTSCPTKKDTSPENVNPIPKGFSFSGMVTSMLTTISCCLPGSYDDEEWDEFVDESAIFKDQEPVSTDVRLPSLPVHEIPYFQLNVPYDGYLSPLSHQGWIYQLSQNAGVQVSWKKTYCTVMNPFSNGLVYTIPHNEGRILLESCYCEKNLGMSTSPKIMELMPYKPLVKFNCAKLFNAFESHYRELSEFLLSGRAPLNVLVHHVMLYHYYPTSMKDVLWKAVEVYMDTHCTEERYSRIQVEAAKRKLGDIRLYFVCPSDIYKFTNSKDWITIATRGFISYIQAKKPLCLGSIPVNNKNIAELFPYASSSNCMAWLTLLVCAGSNGSRFPLHTYINVKTRILECKTSVTDFLYSDEDLLFFEDKETIDEFKPIQRQLLKELTDCDIYSQAVHNFTVTHFTDSSNRQSKGIQFYDQGKKVVHETKETPNKLEPEQITKQMQSRLIKSQTRRLTSYSSSIAQKGHFTPLLITRVAVH
ncbi:uncharacterized protein SOCG_04312 [Schizosaccharomyces octosporus yFS286]|uniref:Uncharacterized protein n=1 Tax=Schizosaccharomyces octosporus (strain yFS286) TaxID=483514 RepID=S9R965_SCHOY|nr:uncharacterized protein SOCG_04312 [Schizosaccharomyces octosporus yFS286]EPX70644.1 hypothetical protein SOCG_04312 [Schizosaccharomyces octosporus yFS286]